MKRIDRYLGSVIIRSTLMVLMVLLAVQSFIQLAAQLQDVGKGDYSFAHALLFVPLMLASDVYQLFPMAALIGCLLGLGRLSDSSELVVIRASGQSLYAIAKTVAISALLMLLVVTAIGELVAPKARDYALLMKKNALSEGKMLSTRSGVWLRDHLSFVHIAQIKNRYQLKGITLYELNRQHRLKATRFAQSASFDRTHGRWTFFDVKSSVLGAKKITTQVAAKQHWPVSIDTHLLGLSKVDPNQQTLAQLYRYMHFRIHAGLGVGRYAYVFWKRIFAPLSSLVMILLAIPFIFGPMTRSTKGVRVVVGIMAGFGFYLMNQFFGPLSQVYQIPPILAAFLPSFLCLLLGAALLRRQS